MRIVITLISMVLIIRVCFCAVVNKDDGRAVVPLRASSNSSSTSTESENPLRNVIKCFKADSLLKCFNDRVGGLIRFWREALLNSVRRNGNGDLNWSQSFEYTLRDLGKAVYYGFTAFFQRNDDSEARSGLDDTLSSDSSLERGHKKKKVHKEIKKLVIKIIVAIFLVMQKIKWILLMIQTLLLNNFILVATLFVLSKTFKVWHEIKHYKHHPEKQVIVYDNVHHNHFDDVAPHPEVEDSHGHSHGWNWWGARSFQTGQTEPTTNDQDYENDNYYSNRVARSVHDRARRRRKARKRDTS